MIDLLTPIAGIVLSEVLVMASLWQVEICTCWAREKGFDMPFYLVRGVNWAVARDLWYAVNLLGWILGTVSGAYLGASLG